MDRAMREYEIRGFIATFFYALGILFVVLFLEPQFALGCIFILALGDPSAALVGMRYGQHKLGHNPDKSLEGSLAMLSVCILVLQILGFGLITTLFVSVSATIFESLRVKVSDNLLIPLISGMIMVSL